MAQRSDFGCLQRGEFHLLGAATDRFLNPRVSPGNLHSLLAWLGNEDAHRKCLTLLQEFGLFCTREQIRYTRLSKLIVLASE